MRFLFYLFVVLPALLILLVGGTIALSLQPVPLVAHPLRLDSRSADEAWTVLRRLVTTAAKARDDVTLNVSKAEFEGLLAFASRGLPGLTAEADLNDDRALARATLALPKNPFGAYLNVTAGLVESDRGLVLAPLSLGRVDIPGALVEWAASLGLDLLLGQDSGSLVLDAVKRVRVDARQISVDLDHDPQMLARLKSWDERLAEVRDQVQPLGDPATVRVYLSRLIEKAGQQGGGRGPLADTLSTVFALARERSAANDPVAENRAAILALAGLYGDERIFRLVGPVVTDALRSKLPRGRTTLVVGREDLPKHFLISAVLQVATTSGMSYAVGELKELLDTGKGGTGFSFVDLAADRAGVRFAEVALAGATARKLQERLAAGPAEAAFFPSIAGLPEWMPQAAFEQRFGGLDDERYRAVVRDIDRRIEGLPTYAG